MRTLSSALAVALLLPVAAAAATTPITLKVDASEVARRIVHVRETIPARPGALVLAYPKWIPGYHSPAGPLVNLVGLKLSAGGKPLAWRRDPVDLHLIRCDVPKGVTSVEASFDWLGTSAARGNLEALASPQLAYLQWHTVLLLPEGAEVSKISVAPSVRLPAAWKYGTALEAARSVGAEVTFKIVDVETLVDSPVLMGAHFRTLPLDDAHPPRHQLSLAADTPAALELKPADLKAWRALVLEGPAMLGERPYRRYHFLLALSDALAPFYCTEHHDSTELRFPERALVEEDRPPAWLWAAAPEFAHAWNGKHRRPHSLATKHYSAPQKGDLLWVYEGLTQYLGFVLAARAGLNSVEYTRAIFAEHAAAMEATAGRSWRPLGDTAVAASLLFTAPGEWTSWRRSIDYYQEGALVWLEADVLIRQRTKGARSLDDFLRAFFGSRKGAPRVSTYTRDEVQAALAAVTPHDWRGFFRDRIDRPAPHAPISAFEAAGWKLVFKDTPSKWIGAAEKEYKLVMAADHALGLLLKDDGGIADVRPGSSAWKAGIAPGMKLLGVNGRRWSVTVLRDALRATVKTARSVELLVENVDHYRLHRLDYRGGERHAQLERVKASPDLLGAIFARRTN
jgi:predicted metalloprotease with PDZ domain